MPRVPTPDPDDFAAQWVAAWNARDVEAVLSHFADDIVFTSPTAVRFAPESGGTVRGKEALRRYWTVALDANPDLHFDLIAVYAGVDTIVVNYGNQAGGVVAEVFTFDAGRIVAGHATHLQR